MRALTLALVAVSSVAVAQPAPPPEKLIGSTEVTKFAPTTFGFIDDVVASDDKRLAYVIADGATKAELHVVTLADKTDKVVDLAAIALHPVTLALVGDKRAFVVNQLDDGRKAGALVELETGKVVYKLDAAHAISLVTFDGATRIAVHRQTTNDKKITKHELDIMSLESGKRYRAGRGLDVDDSGNSASLDFKVNNWAGDFTFAAGVKGGVWDKKNDSRSPPTEATYDLVTGKFTTAPIKDLFEQRKRFQVLAEENKNEFIRFSWDRATLQAWWGGKSHDIAVDENNGQYDPKSLLGVIDPKTHASWFMLKVDPVNAAAVARKKADLEYTDVFFAAEGAKAVRKARLLAPGARFHIGALGKDRFYLIERNAGFDRGGKTLTIYQPAP